ncbi:MAG: hypothetical protein MZV64_11760 [Ignavibacteriales bacterium]|nr:hypothetical protein [Ignavibacteriales bacterium]
MTPLVTVGTVAVLDQDVALAQAAGRSERGRGRREQQEAGPTGGGVEAGFLTWTPPRT